MILSFETALSSTEQTIVELLVIASVVAIVARRVRIPDSVALVMTGVLIGATHMFGHLRLTSGVILLVFLPPLLFEGAVNLDIAELWKRRGQIATLAFAGTGIAAVFIFVAVSAVSDMSTSTAALLAVMLAATDPVSVLATFKVNPVDVGLRTLIEGESIFNDALAVVMYGIAVEIAFPHRHGPTALSAIGEFGREVGVGVLVGLIVGVVAHRLMSLLDDHLVEIMLSLTTAFGSYLLADRIHGSGVIATVTAGLLVGNYGQQRSMAAESRAAMLEFWDVIAFVANSALFLLIGIEFRPGDLAHHRTALVATAAIVAMFAGRAAIAWGLLFPFTRTRRPKPDRPKRNVASIPPRWRGAIFWGGLRGSIPIALVLSLASPIIDQVNIVATVFAVVMFSLVVQGVTFKGLLNRLGLIIKRSDTEAVPDE